MAKRTGSKKPKAICSFCGRSGSGTDTFIEGPNNVFICPECVELCHNIIRQGRGLERPPSLEPMGITSSCQAESTFKGPRHPSVNAREYTLYQCGQLL